MKKRILIKIFVICFLCCGVDFHASAATVKTAKENKPGGLLSRIDFGNSYIMGQTIKSGAVYLMQRKKSEIKSMLEYRTTYRKEILENFVVQEQKGYDGTNNKSK